MSKATANKAIDFTRLFAVKDHMASKLAEPTSSAESAFEEGRGGVSSELSSPLARKAPHDAKEDAGIEVADTSPTARPEPESPSEAPAIQHKAATAPLRLESRAQEGAAGTLGPLRLGLPRPMHERIRAAAAFASISPPAFVRDVLESTAPRFERGASLSNLAKMAREAFPEAQSTRRTVEVRMQVPMTEDLHQRLLQLAALRAQTLGACLVDLLEQQLPR